MPERTESPQADWRPERRSQLFGPYSFFISLGLHLIILIVVVCILQALPARGTLNGNSDDRTVGIVFSKDQGYASPEETLRMAAGGNLEETANDPAADTSPASPVEALLPNLDTIGMSGTGEARTAESTNGSPANSLLPGNEAGTSRTGTGSGDGQSVGFATLRGRGKKFVYVLDHSESMKWSNGHAMIEAIAEAKKSIMSLDPVAGAKKFQVISYNHEAKIFEKGGLLDITAPNQERACRFLDTLFPEGGTDPVAALEMAMALRPDVIFFLTDADEEISAAGLARIHDQASRNKVGQIHVFEFRRQGSPEKKSFVRLAEENGGGYFCELLP